MTDHYAIDPADFGAMVNDMFVTTRDHLIRECGEDTGLSIVPAMLGGMIGYMFQITQESEAHEKIASDVNQALERTGTQYRLRAID